MNHITIVEEKRCCGCSGCSSVCPKQCIVLKPDELGFRYPEVDTEKCIGCGLCTKVCPFINPSESLLPKACYAAANREEKELLLSSSGGIFIALARKTIERGGVVFGAAFNDDWSVSHCSAETIDEVRPMMTSKYLQSQMDGVFGEVKSSLEGGKEVLFTGTPCQIAGLKHFLRKDYSKLLTVEVVCHGVPSPSVWQNYLDETFIHSGCKQKGEKQFFSSKNAKTAINWINFRDKKNGWKNYGFALNHGYASRDLKDSDCAASTFFEHFGANLYMQAFLNNWSLRPSCFDCKAKGGSSQADIAIGDFWGIDKFSSYHDDDRGTSCIICRTLRGKQMILDLDNIKLTGVPYDIILAGNPSIECSADESIKTKQFRQLFVEKGISATMQDLCYVPIWRRIISRVKHTIERTLNFK